MIVFDSAYFFRAVHLSLHYVILGSQIHVGAVEERQKLEEMAKWEDTDRQDPASDADDGKGMSFHLSTQQDEARLFP